MTPWTVAHQAPPSMEFSRQNYWNWLPFPTSGGFPDPGMEPGSPASQVDSSPPEPPGKDNNEQPLFTGNRSQCMLHLAQPVGGTVIPYQVR